MPFGSFLNTFNIVKQLPIFCQLNWWELQLVSRHADLVHFKKGDLICQQGSEPDGFYCLVSGRVQAYNLRDDGDKDNVDFIYRGMYFGIISVLTGENHSLNFQALNDSLVLKISKEHFNQILKKIPRLSIELSQSLSRRIRSKVTNQKTIFESTILSTYSPVKGSGSSTYAMNLALGLQKETSKKVLLLSIDLAQKNESATPGVEGASPQWKEEGTINLKEIMGDYERMSEAVIEGELPIDFLHVEFSLEDTTIIDHISEFVSFYSNTYHYVVVDLPNEMNDVVIQTLKQSDMVHLITLQRQKDLELTRLMIDALQESLKGQFNPDRVKVILSNLLESEKPSEKEMKEFLNYDVYAALPYIQEEHLSEAKVTRGVTLITTDESDEYTKAIRRISRRVGGVLVGLALGGGAALGVAHIGVLRVLEEQNIPVDILVGSSMGALIGGLWALGKNTDELEFIAREFKNKSSLLKLIDPILPWDGLVGGRSIKYWLRDKFGKDTSFFHTKIPFKTVSYDLRHRRELVIDTGSIVDAVRQSIAIPGVIKPIMKKGQVIIDGGVLNPLPTNVLISHGVSKIIAVNVLQSPEQVQQGYELLEKQEELQKNLSFWKAPFRATGYRIEQAVNHFTSHNIANTIVQTLQASEYVLAEQSGRQADVVIHPDLTGIGWYELHRVDELINLGEQAARNHLNELQQLISS